MSSRYEQVFVVVNKLDPEPEVFAIEEESGW